MLLRAPLWLLTGLQQTDKPVDDVLASCIGIFILKYVIRPNCLNVDKTILRPVSYTHLTLPTNREV